MEPTYRDGERVRIERVVVRQLRVGDVVVAHDPLHPRRRLLKRILGLPGDVVELGGPSEAPVRLTVPSDAVFLGSDAERPGVWDGRHFGPVPLRSIVGRVVGPRRAIRGKPAPHEGLPNR